MGFPLTSKGALVEEVVSWLPLPRCCLCYVPAGEYEDWEYVLPSRVKFDNESLTYPTHSPRSFFTGVATQHSENYESPQNMKWKIRRNNL